MALDFPAVGQDWGSVVLVSVLRRSEPAGLARLFVGAGPRARYEFDEADIDDGTMRLAQKDVALKVRRIAEAEPRSEVGASESSPGGFFAADSRFVSMDVSPRDPLSVAQTRGHQPGENSHALVEPVEVS